MDKVLKPERLDVEPGTVNTSAEYKHWYKTFTYYLSALTAAEIQHDKLQVLTNLISYKVYCHIADINEYDTAIQTLQNLYVKPKNVIAARHKLRLCKQQAGESIDQFVLRLDYLSKECDCQNVTAEQHRLELMRDAFIAGMSSIPIRQRLLENRTLTFQQAYDQARAQELAYKSSETFQSTTTCNITASDSLKKEPLEVAETHANQTSDEQSCSFAKSTCYFCGKSNHERNVCPAKAATCNYCNRVGHYAKVCRKRLIKLRYNRDHTSNAISKTTLAPISASVVQNSNKVLFDVKLNGVKARSLMDTGSSDCYIDKRFAKAHTLKIYDKIGEVTLAETSVKMPIQGQCIAKLNIANNEYPNVVFHVLNNLATDVIIGEKIFQEHSKVTFSFDGSRPALTLNGLAKMCVPYPKLFSHLSKDCKPIADKPRRFSKDDAEFIHEETKRLLKEDLIEPSNSPWRAQVVVVKNEQSGKRRMVIDYSRTINRYTSLDAYPLPQIEDIVSELSKYKVFTTVDLKSAYHQIELNPRDREFTAFQAGQELYQWRRLPFGLTNAVPEFQRAINAFVTENNLRGCFPYLDDITIAGEDQEEHDFNLKAFNDAAAAWNLTINEKKTQFSQKEISILGYKVAHQSIKPDPERVRTLLEMRAPKTNKELQRLIGLFAYYARWIPSYSDKIRPLIKSTLPLSSDALFAFDVLKQALASAALHPIDNTLPLTVETDASDFAIAGTLNQEGRPIAFHSRTLSPAEQRHSSVEKEAYAVVEALRKWRHLLIGRHFTLVTDQKSVSFMFDRHHASKIKNEKIMRWRMDLSPFHFTILHRPGKKMIGPDTLSRAFCGTIGT